MNVKSLFLLAFLAVFVSPAAFAAPDPALPKCPPDWKVEVIARTPQLEHPSVVCAAPDGRIFVAQDPVDMRLPSDSPSDSILCIHPDGKITLFATNLHAVFGLAYVDGKVYVHHTPNFSVFTDDNGVGKNRTELFTTNPDPNGGGRGFNDHIPSNMRLAMDGYFYMSTGDKGIYGAVGKDGSKVNLEGGGLMRFRPDGTQLELYCNGTRNHLDVAINAEDEMFTYDNTDDGNGWWTRVTHMVDGGFYGYPYDYKPQRGYTLWKITDYGGGSPTGGLAYNEDALPEEYRGNLFLCEWGRKQLLRLRVTREGGSYRIDSREDFLTAGTEEFRPVGIGVSPDGMSLYIGDWNISGWKKPDIAGRLLKVTYTGKSLAAPKPAWWLPAAMGQPFKATTDELIGGLKHPSQNVRLVAQRRLAERKEALPKLIALLKDASAPALARAHAVWALDAMDGGVAARKEIMAAVAGNSDLVRSQAVRQLGTRRVKEAVKPLLAALADKNAAIRFRAATALGRIGDVKAVPSLMTALGEKDFFTRYAMFTALNRIGRADYFAWAEIARGLDSTDPAVREGVLFAMRETYDDACVKALGEFVASAKAAPEARAAALEVLAELHRKRPEWKGSWWATQPVKSPPPPKTVEWTSTPTVLASVRASLNDASPQLRRAAVNAVEITADLSSAASLRTAFGHESDAEIQKAILHALGSLHDKAAGELIAGLLAQPKNFSNIITNAIDAAGQIGDKAMVGALSALLSNSRGNEALKSLTPVVIDALGATKSVDAVPTLTEVLKTADNKTRPLANAALQRIGGPAVRDAILPLLESPDLSVRRLALATAGALKDRKLVPNLTKAYENQDTRTDAVLALAQIGDPASLDIFLDNLDDRNGQVRNAVFTGMRNWADRVLKEVEARHQKRPFTRGELGVLHRIYERNATARSGPLFEGVAKPQDPAAYVAFAEKNTGDANRGKKIFTDLNGVACIKCHRVGKEGGEVGPDLASVGSKYNRAQLIEAVIYPSKQILDGYHQTRVVTKSDEEVNGIVRQETGDAITLVDTEGKLHAIKKTDIASKKESELSLMPEGLQLGLSLQDFSDLTSYLETLREGQPAKK